MEGSVSCPVRGLGLVNGVVTLWAVRRLGMFLRRSSVETSPGDADRKRIQPEGRKFFLSLW